MPENVHFFIFGRANAPCQPPISPVIRKQVKFTHIAKRAITNVNSENNITKYFTIKDLNYTFNDIGNLFSLFHLNITSLSFHFDELQYLISNSKNGFNNWHMSNYKLRSDLMIHKERELESVFIEIIQKDSKNIVVGCIYRHPCMQQSDFNDEYLKPLPEILISENKEIILLRDFNIDFLKCDSNKNVFDFLNIIYSINLLPNINLNRYHFQQCYK